MEEIIVHCDGASRGNPGPAAVGIVIFTPDMTILEEYKERIGTATNNVAEYTALIRALERARAYTRENVRVIMDSELVIRQMTGEYRVRNAQLKPLHEEAQRLEQAFMRITYSSTPRGMEAQAHADRLANEALDA